MYMYIDETRILRIADNAYIPIDPRNKDYQEYMKWLSKGNKPTPGVLPKKTIPYEITMRQARLILHRIGKLSGVTDMINSLDEPDRTEAKIEWEYSSAIRRDNRFIKMLGKGLNLNKEQIDELFIEASKL